MWIKSSGALTENVFQVTTPASSHLLIIGDAAAIVDTGIAATADRMIEELESYLGTDGELSFVLITHAHFDHVGAIPELRARYPEVEVLGSPQIAEYLRDQSIKESFYQRNVECAQAVGKELTLDRAAWCAQLEITRILGDGDSVDLGDDVVVKLISVPGHTEDCVAYFVQPDSALAAGEAVGFYNGREKIVNCCTGDYEDYLESLVKLSGLDVKVLSLPHAGVLTGELVTRFFMDAKAELESFQNTVRDRLQQGELLDEIVAAILPEWQVANICPEGPFVQEQEQTLRSIVKALASMSKA